MEAFLRNSGAPQSLFDEVHQEAADFASDIRRRTVTLENPVPASMFNNVYTDPHPVVEEQAAWLAAYEASFDEQGGGH
jgi:pyruvate dehydrogenase E1 component alpha subunit